MKRKLATLLTTLALTLSQANAVTIDVMVVYDNKSVEYLSQKGISQKLFAADLVNKAAVPFANSNIDVDYNLSHVMAIDYTTVAGTDGMNMKQDLIAVAGNSDVKRERIKHKADLVHFIVNIERPQYGKWMSGIAYEPCRTSAKAISPTCSKKYAYSVSSIQDIDHGSIALTASHEIGHNLGAGHATSPNFGATKTSNHGHYFTGNDGAGYHTVMSYKKGSSTRIPFFSTPCLKHKGTAVGSKAANNTAEIANNIGIIANYYGDTQSYTAPAIGDCPQSRAQQTQPEVAASAQAASKPSKPAYIKNTAPSQSSQLAAVKKKMGVTSTHQTKSGSDTTTVSQAQYMPQSVPTVGAYGLLAMLLSLAAAASRVLRKKIKLA